SNSSPQRRDHGCRPLRPISPAIRSTSLWAGVLTLGSWSLPFFLPFGQFSSIPRAVRRPILRAFFVLAVSVLYLPKHAALLEFFPCKDTTPIIGNAVNPADGRERLVVAGTNFQRAVAVTHSQGAEDICVSEESIGVNSNGFLPGHISADVPGNNIHGSGGR